MCWCRPRACGRSPGCCSCVPGTVPVPGTHCASCLAPAGCLAHTPRSEDSRSVYRAPMEHKGLPVQSFADRDAWWGFLAAQPEGTRGIWLKIARKGSGIESIDHPQALEAALCFGWIDGQRASLDERWFLQRFSPRAKRSRWSKVNRASAERLIEAGMMQPPGLREVERARADGRWDAAYDAQSTATVPDDLAAEFQCHPDARAFFETLDSRNRYSVLHRIAEAKRPETRARRIAKFVAMLEAGEKLYP